MKYRLLSLILSILAVGCSSNDDNTSPSTPNSNFKLVVDGIAYDVPPKNNGQDLGGIIHKEGDKIFVYITQGDLNNTDSKFDLNLVISSGGKFLSGNMRFFSSNFFNPTYDNFIHFPSNYFQVTSFSLDEVNRKVLIKCVGKLYENKQSLTSDSRDIEIDLNTDYIDDGNASDPLTYNGIEQYCRANFNSVPWFARFEHTASSFTNEDAYKIETHFANTQATGSYNFTPSSTDNYVRLSKFNPLTASYDYYEATGQVAYTYREFHGANRYSFIGTFSFVAVNPNNSSDVIQVTNGEFRSYQ
ncbi:MAG: hypothetical protein EOO46_14210 [Flavobacterium sp.]|nr:MAG: hypothetical protein EOO46_14210 [Flavobacterium sp.]